MRLRGACCLIAAAWAAPAGLAQVYPSQPQGQPQPQQPGGGGGFPQGEPRTQRPTTGDPDIDALTPVWSQPLRPAPFQGFPIFPPQLPGYGEYSSPRGLGMPKANLAQLFQGLAFGQLNPAPTAAGGVETGWPSWARTQSREPLPYEPEAALLVRNTDRVWWRPPEEDVAVPLYFHDKLRTIRKGTAVAVREVGEFEILLYGGGLLSALGGTDLTIDAMDDKLVECTLRRFTHVRLTGFGREYRIHLPDGSELRLPPVQAEGAPPGEAASSLATNPWHAARVALDRADEPGWRAGRATVWNYGEVEIAWRRAGETTTIGAGERAGLFLSPVEPGLPAGLDAGGAAVDRDGPAIVCRSGQGGSVVWSGARFALPAGGAVRFDPLLGEPFAPASSAHR